MVDFAQQIMNGLVTGSTYALVALGLTLIYGILKIPNFAHGQAYMWAAYVTFFMITLGLNYWVVLVLVTIIFVLFGMLLEWSIFRPLADKPHINSFIAAIGLVMVMESLIVVAFGSEYKKFPGGLFSNIVSFGDLVLTQQRLTCIIGSVALIFVMYLFINHTRLGESIHAVAQNSVGATLVGINVKRNSTIAFGIGTGLAATAAVLIAPIFLVFPQMGSMLNLKAFVIIILGSMGNLVGAVIGGFLMGLIEALVSGYLSTDFKDFISFGILVLVLLVKPTGLFGGKQ